MITVDIFAQQTVLVVGLARSGLAAVRALTAGQATVIAWDDAALASTGSSAKCKMVFLSLPEAA